MRILGKDREDKVTASRFFVRENIISIEEAVSKI